MTPKDAAIVENQDHRFLSILINALILLAYPAYLYLNLFTLRGIPHYIIGDDGLFVLDGLRMGAGQWIYRDFFQFNAPGIDYVFFFAFKLFGARTWVPNLVTLLIGTLLSWLTLHLTRRIMPLRWAHLTTAFFVIFIYGRWLDATHHWISLFIILLAIRVLLPDRSPSRLLIAGALLGTATFFTQTAGVAAWLAFAVALFYDQPPSISRYAMLKKQASLLLTAVPIWFLLSLQTIRHAGWHTLWYFQAVFPQRYEVRVDSNPISIFLRDFPHEISFLNIENAVFYLLLICTTPIALCVLLWQRRKHRSQPHPERTPIVMLTAVGFLLMATVVTRPTWIRLYAVLLPSLIIFVLALARSLRTRPRLSRLLIALLWFAVILSGLRQTKLNRATYNSIASLPAGKIALQHQDADEFRFLAEHTHPGDLFFQAFAVHLYLPLALNSPVYMDYLRQSPVTRPEFLANAIHALDVNHVHYISLRPPADITFNPAYSHHLDPLYTWIEAHYNRVQRFPSNEELWELKQ
jgi:hypothetical protein